MVVRQRAPLTRRLRVSQTKDSALIPHQSMMMSIFINLHHSLSLIDYLNSRRDVLVGVVGIHGHGVLDLCRNKQATSPQKSKNDMYFRNKNPFDVIQKNGPLKHRNLRRLFIGSSSLRTCQKIRDEKNPYEIFKSSYLCLDKKMF